ncbi:MAG: hypothetical protein RIQ68_1518 [Pseudomonadota bacterium]
MRGDSLLGNLGLQAHLALTDTRDKLRVAFSTPKNIQQ